MYMFLDNVWVKVSYLSLVHLLATVLRPHLARKERLINAFGAGMALSYVFIHLLSEISKGGHYLGVFTFIIVLVGYVVFYYVKVHIEYAKKGDGTRAFTSQISSAWLYSFILVLGVPRMELSTIHIALMAAAIGMHLIHQDYLIGMEHPHKFDKYGKYLLASAPFLGLLVRLYVLPESEIVFHAVTSFLAGAIIFSAVKEELPHPSSKSLKWFLLGIFLYSGMMILLEIY